MTGKYSKWVIPDLSQGDILKDLLQKRGISDLNKFTNISLDNLYDPTLLHDSIIAANHILDYIDNKKKIFIHGDFDVDGVSATSILWDYLFRHQNADVTPYIPSRFEEGYGLSETSIQNMIDKGAELIITVDCGIKDIALVEKYKDQVKFILTDHHSLVEYDKKNKISGAKKEKDFLISNIALANVHPKLGDYPFTDLCGSAVAWKLICVIEIQRNSNKDILEYLDLVSMATVCDLMPLVDENRAIVALGLNYAKKTENIGLKELINSASINQDKLEAYHYGYVLGPRINAAGRLYSAMDSLRLLTTNNNDNAKKLSSELNRINQERQKLTLEFSKKVAEQINKQNKIIVHVENNLPEGILGLIAGELSRTLGKPAIILTNNGETFKGSARSVGNININDILKEHSTLLMRYGGHKQAAGLTLDKTKFNEFKAAILDYANKNINDNDLEQNLYLDLNITLENLSVDTLKSFKVLEPFGFANEEPIIGIQKVTLSGKSLVGQNKNHVRLIFSQKEDTLEAIWFNGGNFYESLNIGGYYDIAGKLSINEWNGFEKINFIIDDILIS